MSGENYKSRLEGARRPAAASETREFTSRFERMRVPILLRSYGLSVKILLNLPSGLTNSEGNGYNSEGRSVRRIDRAVIAKEC